MKRANIKLIRQILAGVMSVCLCHFASAQNWVMITGITAQDIAVGKNGIVWAIGKNFNIYRLKGSTWETIPGGAARVAVDPQGAAWVVNQGGDIYKYNLAINNWEIKPGGATDIAVGANGSVWCIGRNSVPGGYDIYKWNGSNWSLVPGGAMRIAVDASGNAWIVNNSANVFHFEGNTFVMKPGAVKDIGAGADGSIWCTGKDEGIYKWMGTNWQQQSGGATDISVGPDGNAWVVNELGQVYYSGKLQSTAALNNLAADNEPLDKIDDPVKARRAASAASRQVVNATPAVIVASQVTPTPPSSAEVEFENVGAKPVVLYRSKAATLGDSVTSISPESTVKLNVKLGDQFEVLIDGQRGLHPKIYITDIDEPVYISGNTPLGEIPSYVADKYQFLDYQPNQAGIDLAVYNPRNLVETINKKRIFESLDINNGIDYHIDGGAKVLKQGFEYASTNLHEGSNTVNMSYGYSAFSKSWSLNVGGSGTIPVEGVSVKPSLDFGYSEKEMENRSSENVYAYTREQKSIFTITVDPLAARLDPKFKRAVRLVTDATKASQFITDYGTHYPVTVYYGGDRSVYAVMNKNTYSKAKSFGIDLKAAVGVSEMQTSKEKYDKSGKSTGSESTDQDVGEGHLAFSYNQGSKEESVFQNIKTKYRMIGGSGGFKSWEVDESNASPVAAKMDLIYNLIEPRYFKDDTDPAALAKAKSLIKTATDNYLAKLPMLKRPLPPPVAYSITIDKLEVIQEVDDANKNTKGHIDVGLTWTNNGKQVSTQTQSNVWQIPDYSLDFKFVEGNIIYPDQNKYVFYFMNFPDSTTGSFNTLSFNVQGDIFEKDDILWDDNDEMVGQTGGVNIATLNLDMNQPFVTKTFDVDFHDNGLGHQDKIRITYTVHLQISDFDDKLNNW
jgi:hypothetical protein